MRIRNSQRDLNIHLTKCTKMTEDEHRIYMNGVNNGNPIIKEECPEKSNNYSQGGRLKFFKDGKFILELARAREGEKVAWVPVPKKTFWPPPGSATSLSQYRQESSTSLSVSDDNSSIQSSPWQRDHTWKQTSPQRNASNHLTFFYRSAFKKPKCVSYPLTRRPYASISQSSERTKCTTTKKCNRCVNVHQKNTLTHIVQILWNKTSNAINITSPRKRILKELERVTIDDLSLKRVKGKTVSTVGQVLVEPLIETNGNVEEKATSSKNCSYSITSLLKSDKRDEKISSQSTPVQRMTHKEPSYDMVDCHRIDVINTNAKRSPHQSSSDYPVSVGYPPYPYPPYVYGAGVVSPSPYYAPYGRGAGYLPALPALARHNGTYPHWPTHYPVYQHVTARDDNISDVPLNLSKHAD